MSFTYDWTNSPQIAQLRLMVGDTDPTPPGPFFQDAEVSGALNVFNAQNVIIGLSGFSPAVPPSANVYSYARAAHMLLCGLGATRARNLVKKVTDVDLDGAAAAKALQDLGESYIKQEQCSGFFAVSEMGDTAFWMRERLWKQLYRLVA